MIVRIATEGQYRLPEESCARLNVLDDAVAAALDSGDQDGFQRAFTALLDEVRGGELLQDADLASSGLILPPPDLSFAEATSEFTGEGLIPD